MNELPKQTEYSEGSVELVMASEFHHLNNKRRKTNQKPGSLGLVGVSKLLE